MFPHCVDDKCKIFGGCWCPLPNEQEIVAAAAAKVEVDYPHLRQAPNALPLGFGKKLRFITLTRVDVDPLPLVNVWNKIISSKAIGVVKALACIELTEQGFPHMHIMCEINGRAVKRDIQKWNGAFVDVKVVTPNVDSVERVRQYILKNANDERTINYLREKNMSQFYYKNIDALQA